MADWDADDFEPDAPTVTAKATDKWDGEDEDDDCKVNMMKAFFIALMLIDDLIRMLGTPPHLRRRRRSLRRRFSPSK